MIDPAEQQRLENVAQDSWYLTGVAPRTSHYNARIFKRHLRPGSILELGPAEGVMTAHLHPLTTDLTLVEGSPTFCRLLQQSWPSANVVQALFEDYSPGRTFDNIILGHVLEHVADPVAILTRARDWLAPGGRILASVPNSRSLHRQAGVILGLLPAEDALNETDLHHGHRRVYSPELFRNHFLQAGLRIDIFGGYWLKPMSNSQLTQSWNPEMLEAFMQLGERYPDIAAEIYLVASRPDA